LAQVCFRPNAGTHLLCAEASDRDEPPDLSARYVKLRMIAVRIHM